MRRRSSASAAQITRISAMNESKTGSRCAGRFGLAIARFPLFEQRLALDGTAAQQPSFLFGKIRAGVNGAAIVPHQKVAELPDMLEDVVAPLADLVKLIEDRVALGLAHALDARRHQAVDEQRLSTGVGMSDEDRMIVVRDARDIARGTGLLGAIIFVDVQRLLALELVFKHCRNGIVSLVHIGEHGVAAARRQLQRIEERVFVRLRRIAGIDVEPELALAEGADRLAVDLDVADQEYLLVVLLGAL